MFFRWEEIKEKIPKNGIKMKVITGTKAQMVLFQIDPHTEFPPHMHPHEQMGTVLAGALLLKIGKSEKILKPGDAYIVPPNTEHSAKTFNKTTVVLDVFSPPREEYK